MVKFKTKIIILLDLVLLAHHGTVAYNPNWDSRFGNWDGNMMDQREVNFDEDKIKETSLPLNRPIINSEFFESLKYSDEGEATKNYKDDWQTTIPFEDPWLRSTRSQFMIRPTRSFMMRPTRSQFLARPTRSFMSRPTRSQFLVHSTKSSMVRPTRTQFMVHPTRSFMIRPTRSQFLVRPTRSFMTRPTRSQFLVRPTKRFIRDYELEAELEKQSVNRVFENENLWPILFSELKKFGETIASNEETTASPVLKGEPIASPESPLLKPFRFMVQPRVL